MKKTIWKYIVPNIPGPFEIEIPSGYKVLSCGSEGVNPVIWILLNQKAKKETARFLVAWTGIIIESEEWNHVEIIGTERIGPLVYHIFRIREKT